MFSYFQTARPPAAFIAVLETPDFLFLVDLLPSSTLSFYSNDMPGIFQIPTLRNKACNNKKLMTWNAYRAGLHSKASNISFPNALNQP
jgi:hypothetical protein